MKYESKKEYTAMQFKGEITPALEKFIRKNFERDEDDYKPEKFKLNINTRDVKGLGKYLDIVCSGIDRSGYEFDNNWHASTGSWIVFETKEHAIYIKTDEWFHHEFRQVTSIMQANKKAMDKIAKTKVRQ